MAGYGPPGRAPGPGGRDRVPRRVTVTRRRTPARAAVRVRGPRTLAREPSRSPLAAAADWHRTRQFESFRTSPIVPDSNYQPLIC
eukprot:672930-Hanusia_phi.AAC.1